jgi:RNA polymerase-binding transcription factor DksA
MSGSGIISARNCSLGGTRSWNRPRRLWPISKPRRRTTTDREVELRARDRQRKLLAKINAALLRLEDGTYGYCAETSEPISLKRLEARPIATLSVEAQERHERRERIYRDEWQLSVCCRLAQQREKQKAPGRIEADLYSCASNPLSRRFLPISAPVSTSVSRSKKVLFCIHICLTPTSRVLSAR